MRDDEAGSQPTIPPPDRAENIVKGIGFLTLQGLLNAILGLVLLGSLLRLLPSLDYGAYSSLQVTVSIAGAFTVFGLNAAAVKFLAPAPEGDSGWGEAKASLILTTLLSASVSGVLIATAPYLSDYFMKGPSWSWVFYLGALWLFTLSISSVLQGIIQGLRRYALLARVLLLSRVASVGVAVAGLILYQSLFIAILSLSIFNVVISVAAFRTVFRPLLGSIAQRSFGRVMRYSGPLGVATVVAVVTSSADIVVVGGYLDPVSLGIYNAAVTIASVISQLFVVPLTTTLFAEASFSHRSKEELTRGTALALRFTAITVLPASFLAAAVAGQLFVLFSGGSGFASGIPALEMITVFYVFAVVQLVLFSVLQGVGKTKAVLVVGLITALSEIGLSVSLVPGFGLFGAAASRVTVMVLGALISIYFMRDYLKGYSDYPFLAKALLSSGIPAVVVYALSTFVSSRVITLLPYGLIGVVLFLGCARGLRLVSGEDRAFLNQAMPSQLRWVSRLL
jgi:O-antigen/teichoic acid export membrane protein